MMVDKYLLEDCPSDRLKQLLTHYQQEAAKSSSMASKISREIKKRKKQSRKALENKRGI